jgi:hypothetical protein
MQPWIFEVSGNRILLRADRTKSLRANDPEDRELTMSCGGALMILRVAAAAEGLSTSIQLLPESEDADLLAAVELRISDEDEPPLVELRATIEERRIHREHFSCKDLSNKTIAMLRDAAKQEDAWLETLTEKDVRQDVADLIAEADAAQWEDADWRHELTASMHPRRKEDRLTVPNLVATLARVVTRPFGGGGTAEVSRLIEDSPLLAVLGTEGDGPGNWLNAGQALQRVLLVARANGLYVSFLNQPVQVASLRPKLQGILGRSGFPQTLFRLGYVDDDRKTA